MAKPMKDLGDAPYRRFAENLRALRKAKKITREALAVQCGISSRTIANYENGTRIPFADIAKRLAEQLGVTIDDLMVGSQAREGQPADIVREKAKDTLAELYPGNKAVQEQAHLLEGMGGTRFSSGTIDQTDQEILALETQQLLMQLAEERSKKFGGGRGKTDAYFKKVEKRKETLAQIDARIAELVSVRQMLLDEEGEGEDDD